MVFIVRMPSPPEIRASISKAILSGNLPEGMVKNTKGDIVVNCPAFIVVIDRTKFRLDYKNVFPTPLEWLNEFRKTFESEIRRIIGAFGGDGAKGLEFCKKYSQWNFYFLNEDLKKENLLLMIKEWLGKFEQSEVEKYFDTLSDDPLYYWTNIFWELVLFVFSLAQFDTEEDKKVMAQELVNVYIEFFNQYSKQADMDYEDDAFVDAHTAVLKDTHDYIFQMREYLEKEGIKPASKPSIPFFTDDILRAADIFPEDIDPLLEIISEKGSGAEIKYPLSPQVRQRIREFFIRESILNPEDIDKNIIEAVGSKKVSTRYFSKLPSMLRTFLCISQEERLPAEVRYNALSLAEIVLEIVSDRTLNFGPIYFPLGILWDKPLEGEVNLRLSQLRNAEDFDKFNEYNYMTFMNLISEPFEKMGVEFKDLSTFVVEKMHSDSRQLGYRIEYTYGNASVIVKAMIFGEGQYQDKWNLRIEYVIVDGNNASEILPAAEMVARFLEETGAVERYLANMNYSSTPDMHERAKKPKDNPYLTESEIEQRKNALAVSEFLLKNRLSPLRLSGWPSQHLQALKKIMDKLGLNEDEAKVFLATVVDFYPTAIRVAESWGMSEKKVEEIAKKLIDSGVFIEKKKHGRTWFLPVETKENIGLGFETYKNLMWDYGPGASKLYMDNIPVAGSPQYYLCRLPDSVIDDVLDKLQILKF
ncbi:MAG: hypothetical protein QW728_00650 [Thermoplasmata archaeon]